MSKRPIPQHVIHLPFIPRYIKRHYHTYYERDIQVSVMHPFNTFTEQDIKRLTQMCCIKAYNEALKITELNPCIIINFDYTISRMPAEDSSQHNVYFMVATGSIIQLEPKSYVDDRDTKGGHHHE